MRVKGLGGIYCCDYCHRAVAGKYHCEPGRGSFITVSCECGKRGASDKPPSPNDLSYTIHGFTRSIHHTSTINGEGKTE